MQAVTNTADQASDWIEIGTLQDIPQLGSRVASTPDGDIAVFRNADDEVFALRDQCIPLFHIHKAGFFDTRYFDSDVSH